MAITPKKALLYMWSFGFFIYMTDAIFIDRRNPTVANQLLLNKSKHLLQNKVLSKIISYVRCLLSVLTKIVNRKNNLHNKS